MREMMKANLTRMAILLLLLSCMFSLTSVTKGDLVGHRGLIAAHKPYIVFPQNNYGYSSNSLMLNVSFKAMAYANMNYSMTYSLDGQAHESLPIVKHYLGNWVIYHGENDYVDGSAKLPTLSEGSHTVTVFLTLDWEIGDQNGVTVYTYYDNETVDFTVGQDITPVVVEPWSDGVPFSYDELSSQIIVTAPVRNFTYSESDIVVNVSLHIGGHEYEPNTHYVPYQNIGCVYSLDGSEWQNMTLVSSAKSELFPSLPNKWWYSNMWLNYTATLHNVSEGSHYLRIDVKPDSIRTRDISSSQDQPLVYFNVMPSIPQGVEPAQPADATFPAPDLLLILPSALVLAVVAVAALDYRKKRKR